MGTKASWVRSLGWGIAFAAMVWGVCGAVEFALLKSGVAIPFLATAFMLCEIIFWHAAAGIFAFLCFYALLVFWFRIRTGWWEWFGRRGAALVALSNLFLISSFYQITGTVLANPSSWTRISLRVLAEILGLAALTVLFNTLADRFQGRALAGVARKIYAGAAVVFLANLAVYPALRMGERLRQEGGRKPRPPAGAPNLILLTIDGLRADRLGYDGNRQIPTANIDRLAQEGVIFKNAFSQSDWTYPSFVSIMTGLYPDSLLPCETYLTGREPDYQARIKNGFSAAYYEENAPPLSADQVTLAEFLSKSGYQTAGFVTNWFLGSPFQIPKGFDEFMSTHDLSEFTVYDHAAYRFQPVQRIVARSLDLPELYAVFCEVYPIIREDLWVADPESAVFLQYHAGKWLRKHHREKFFVWLHYFEAHYPYGDPWMPAPSNSGYQGEVRAGFGRIFDAESGDLVLNQEDLDQLRRLYDHDLFYLDRELGNFFQSLKKNGLWDNTIVILTADHGEQFMEHGHLSHGYNFYQEEARVPLIIKLPGAEPKRLVTRNVELVDLLPTILEYLDLPVPDSIQGKSLMGLIEGREGGWPDRAYSVCNSLGDPTAALRSGDDLLIYNLTSDRAELYDLKTDPGATMDLSKREPELTARLSAQVKEISGRNRELRQKLHSSAPKVKLSPKDLEKLKALGYVK